MAKTSLPDRNETELVRRAQRGDEFAFEALLNAYNSPILNYCFRLVGDRTLAEDMAQETFIKAFLNIAAFDAERRFSPWLYRIAHNLCVDYLRRGRIETDPLVYETEEGEEVRVDIGDETMAPDVVLERGEIRRRFEEALGEVPEIYRAPLVLRHQEDLSYQEIADVLQVPIGTVKARIHRGRSMLQEMLADFIC